MIFIQYTACSVCTTLHLLNVNSRDSDTSCY